MILINDKYFDEIQDGSCSNCYFQGCYDPATPCPKLHNHDMIPRCISKKGDRVSYKENFSIPMIKSLLEEVT